MDIKKKEHSCISFHRDAALRREIMLKPAVLKRISRTIDAIAKISS